MAPLSPPVSLCLFMLFSFSQFADAVDACNNTVQKVMIKRWVNGVEMDYLVGSSAKFGATLPVDDAKVQKLRAILAKPSTCCVKSSSKLMNSIAIAKRGDCEFTYKASIAESGGAAGLIVINDYDGLQDMVCADNQTSLNIRIPVIMIPKSSGEDILNSLADGKTVEALIYAPERPIVTPSIIVLWSIAVGTLTCASLWSGYTTREQERYNQLSPKSQEKGPNMEEETEDEVIEINAKMAILFVIAASTFLVLLYFFMAPWFNWLLIIMFCIGGTQGMHACLVTAIQRICKGFQGLTINLPICGEVLVLSIVILPICIAFAATWALNRKAPIAWVGQDILGVCLMATVLQMVRLPNIKVASLLLTCAFCYDIFWVFISPLIFKTSVMITVARGVKNGGESIPMVFKIPRYGDPWGGDNILGHGDILFPGLLVVFSYRFDVLKKKDGVNGYFPWLITGYGFGLFLTYFVLYIMDGHGQPALLYLVPCTLGTIIVLGLVRKELGDLWNYGRDKSGSSVA
ncbi:signal peptide peptidase-like 2 [Dioscorea cayenensis subsp. rotundata]|uniref:Signal peptide peptidase-like 2 n=1 Tax=Dioscorea cayennensis subsp. rotundata TaxID=55577 RepID=A0AB40CIW9_DIOCR|nr:signal peptide peptidase-like 2 [Dioscorea cayenensis subsp. rotundata]